MFTLDAKAQTVFYTDDFTGGEQLELSHVTELFEEWLETNRPSAAIDCVADTGGLPGEWYCTYWYPFETFRAEVPETTKAIQTFTSETTRTVAALGELNKELAAMADTLDRHKAEDEGSK